MACAGWLANFPGNLFALPVFASNLTGSTILDIALKPKNIDMKSFLTTLLASTFLAGFSFAGDDCGGCKKDQKEEAIIIAGDDCEKEDCDKDKEEAVASVTAGDCKDGCECEKCSKKDDKEEEALIAGDDCEKDGCKKDKEAALIAGDDCEKEDCDKDKEAVLAHCGGCKDKDHDKDEEEAVAIA
jgi:hypothetical protein